MADISAHLTQSILHQAKHAQRGWASLSPRQRAAFVFRASDYILDNTQRLVQIIHEENGKPRVEALSHELISALGAIKWVCTRGPKLLKPKPISMSVLKHKKSTIHYIPYGVIGIIAPWNFPLSIPFGEVVTALIAGNAVILKPSEILPRIGRMIKDIVDAMNLPAGVFQLVEGGPEVGKALVASVTDKIIFTGSSRVGQQVMHACVDQFKPYSMELGGKDAMVVFEDADIDAATSAALWGSMANAGQACSSVERIYVHRTIAKPFKEMFLKKIGSLRLAHGDGYNTDQGKITLPKQKDVYDRHLTDAREHGNILMGGKFSEDRTQIIPTVVMGDKSLLVAQEESFGAMVYLDEFQTRQEAIDKANNNPYGLLASVWSRNRTYAQSVAKELTVGSVLINEVLYTHGLFETPWGGRKASGWGHVHGELGLMEMVYPLHIHADRFGFLMKPIWWFPYSKKQYEFLLGFGGFAYGRRLAHKLKGLLRMVRDINFLWKEPRT